MVSRGCSTAWTPFAVAVWALPVPGPLIRRTSWAPLMNSPLRFRAISAGAARIATSAL